MRVQESTDRAVWLLNAYGVVALLASAVAGFVAPVAIYGVGPLLLLMPLVVLLLGMRSVAPENHPSRDDQVMWLVGVTLVASILASFADRSIAPTAGTRLMDRLVIGLGSAVTVWILLAGVRYLYDSNVSKQRFAKPWHCRGCGYDLRGSVSLACPECGDPVHCLTCNETFMPSVDNRCLHCGAKRMGVPSYMSEDDDI